MLDEAGSCFVSGLYTGCIVSLAAGVEHGLGELCPDHARERFDNLIGAAFACGYLLDEEREVLDDLRQYRNDMAHSKIVNLAAGKNCRYKKWY